LMFATHHATARQEKRNPRRVVKLTEQEQLAKSLAFNVQPKDFRSKAPTPQTQSSQNQHPRDEVIGIDF